MNIQSGNIKILNQDFTMWETNQPEGDGIVIQHIEWKSIVGSGATVNDALSSLGKLINEVKPHYCGMPDNLLSRDGIEMRNWLSTVEIKE